MVIVQEPTRLYAEQQREVGRIYLALGNGVRPQQENPLGKLYVVISNNTGDKTVYVEGEQGLYVLNDQDEFVPYEGESII